MYTIPVISDFYPKAAACSLPGSRFVAIAEDETNQSVFWFVIDADGCDVARLRWWEVNDWFAAHHEKGIDGA